MNKDPRQDDDFEPTIRIERGEDQAPASTSEDTSTRKVGKPEAESATGRFFRHITGIFRRRDGNFEPVMLKPETTKVSLEPSESEAFPELDTFYERSEEIGSGGQARLFRGFDRHLRRMAAVKSLREEHGRNKELREKFIAEAMITAQLDHPAIVPVYSIHRDKHNNLHLAMKLIHGRPFQSYLADLVRHYERDGFSAQEEHKSLDYRLEIFLSVCDALEYAHNRNIMHCDLKPENIMIGEYHEAYLMDWGLARRIDDPEYDPDSWQSPTYITGTPRFLSPEALKGEHCDQRADIYAMGLILYEVVTLQFAYDGEDHRDTINRIRRGEMRPVTHRFGYPIPVDLRKIILKAAAWDKEKRYQSMNEFSTDVRRFIRGEEVSANPDGLLGKLGRFGYRHRRLMFITTLIMVALGAVAVSFTLYDRVKAGMVEKVRAEFREERDHELMRLLAGTLNVGRTFDRRIAKIEHDLSAITSEALLLLNADVRVPADEPVYSLSGMYRGKVPPNMVMAPGFGHEVDIDHIFCHTAPGAKPANVDTRMRKLAMLRSVCLRAMIESRQDSKFSERNLPLLKQSVLNSGAPLISVYFGFRDGLFVVHPCDKTLPESYDHRQRPWYKERVDGSRTTTAPLWSSPYLSSDDSDMVLTCTLPMIDDRGKFHGVAAADVSLLRLVESLRSMGASGGYLLEKSLVDGDGTVIADIGENFLRESRRNYSKLGDEHKVLKYKDIPLLERFKSRRNGIIIRREGDKYIAYLFAAMYSEKWYYIEKIDLVKFLAQTGVKIPDGVAPNDGR